MATLPPKLYFRIGEVANLVGVEPHVLRYWEREFRSIRPTKSAKGQRVYSRRDVENLMRVRDLLYADGFTIAGAKKKLQRNGTEPDAAIDAGAELDASVQVEASAAAMPARIPAEPRQLQASGDADARSDDVRSAPDGHVRTALTELRTEIEAFLTELGG
jgi:DNA-binding transcriptional MerR regulator